jgi:hypothetical protein
MRKHGIPRVALLSLLLAVGASALRAQDRTPVKQSTAKDDSQYVQIVERAKKGDPSVDFVKLREAFWEWRADEKNRADPARRAAMVEAFNQKNYAKAAELVEYVLEYEFVQRGLHVAAEDAFRQTGNEAKANFHRDIAQKLLQALLSTGDGKTPETAYRVLTIREEYLIMEELGLKVSSQTLATVGNKAYDVLTGEDKAGQSVSLYFDISSFFGGRKNKK